MAHNIQEKREKPSEEIPRYSQKNQTDIHSSDKRFHSKQK